MTDTLIPGSAAALYALAVALEAAADSPLSDDDVAGLIAQGRAWVTHIEAVPGGLGTVYWRDAGAAFLRAWARHEEPAKARELIGAAEDLETARDLALATMPRLDA
jgi:hypothetical protein